jgi:hypothetical protein
MGEEFEDAKLRDAEAALIGAVEAGKDYVPASGHMVLGIRGGLIRAILLGTRLKHHPEKTTGRVRAKVRITPHGIRIVPAAARNEPAGGPLPAKLLPIAGKLDLTGLAAPGGGYLPPLELSGCEFEESIQLSTARIQDLTLRGSRFSRLEGLATHIHGNLILDRCRPCTDPADSGERDFAASELVAREGQPHRLHPPREERTLPSSCPCPMCKDEKPAARGACQLSSCTLDLSSAVVGGGLHLTQCYLRAPGLIGRAKGPSGLRDEFAADLRGIEIGDRVEIRRCLVVGALRFVSAKVASDVWIRGGKFVASAERPTLDFQFATIGGMLAFQIARAARDDKETEQGFRGYPVAVIGQISAIGLTAGEVWIGEGLYFAHDNKERGTFPTINFAKADIARSFKIGAYHAYHVGDPSALTGAAKIQGEICLLTANVGKNLEIHGLDSEGISATLELKSPFYNAFAVRPEEAPATRLTAHGLKLDRRIHITSGSFRDARRHGAAASGAAGTTGGKSGPARLFLSSIDLWKSTIGTGVRIDENCRCVGAIRMNSCVIGREVAVKCRRIDPADDESPENGADPSNIPLLFDASESTIRGHFKIGRREPRYQGDEQGAPRVAVTVGGGVSLESTSVQGSVLLAHVTMELGQFPLDSKMREAKERNADSEEGEEPREANRIALNLRDCICGSDLEVHALRWTLPLALAEADKMPPHPPRTFSSRRFTSIDQGSFAVIDLRGLQCDLLVDGFGAEWGLIYRVQLRLAGIRIGDVEPLSHRGPHTRVAQPHKARLEWLAFQQLRQKFTVEDETPVEEHGTSRALPKEESRTRLRARWEAFWNRFWHRLHCAREENFLPQAYDTFASAYRKAGEDTAAEAILVEKKNLQNVVRFHRMHKKWYNPVSLLSLFFLALVVLAVGWWLILSSGLVPDFYRDVRFAAGGMLAAYILFALWPYCVAIFQTLFRWGFRYGLSPGAALLSFVLLIVVGWVGVHGARNGGFDAVINWQATASDGLLDDNIALVLDVEHEPTIAKEPPLPPRPPPPPAPRNPCETIPDSLPPVAAAPEPQAAVSFGDAPTNEQLAAWPPDAVIEGQAIHAQPTPCNRNVSSLLYALDVFLPLIDLDQERRCSVRDADPATGHDAYFHWRLLKTVYELLGWVVTSLVILTFTGVLRRDLER